jgi:two-component system response regulator AtoC
MKVLQANGWSRRKTAKWLNISYRSLLYKLQEAEVPALPARIRKSDAPKPSETRPS